MRERVSLVRQRVTPLPEVVDAHVHFWDLRLLDYPWLSAQPRLQRPFLPEHLPATGVPVAGLVVVQADCRWDQASAELRWLSGLSADSPLIHGVVAAVPLELGDACAPILADLAEEPLAVGVRRLIQEEAPGFCTQPGFVTATRRLADAGLVSDLCVRAHQLPEVIELVEHCPRVTFVLDHLGKPDIAGKGYRPWVDDLARLAALPNVSCKLSGLTSEAGPGWSADQLRPFLEHAIDCFSPQRCLFGSDWPVASLTVGYQAWFALVLDALSDLAPPEQAAVLAGNARRLYQRRDNDARSGGAPC